MRKVKHIYNHWFPEKLSASAVTIGYTIYYSMPKEFVPYRVYLHEMEHIRQIRELGVAVFYFRYLVEYLLGRLRGENHWQAYKNISFEIEARRAERK